jgi:hypothetical protein
MQDPKLTAVNTLVAQVRKLTADWANQAECSSQQLLDIQKAVSRLNEATSQLTVELGEMRTRTVKKARQ